jgi:hypothetical protein
MTLPLGIHFTLPEEDYFADPGIGSSGMKRLATDAVEFQDNRLHGTEKETDSLLWGKALHARVLEGKATFEARFPVLPKREDYPDALDTMDELKAVCERHNLKKSGSKAQLKGRIREVLNGVRFWDEIIAEATSDEDAMPITSDIAEQIERAAQYMQRDPLLERFMLNGTFRPRYTDAKGKERLSAGEVAIFVEDQGVRLRAKIDRLFEHAKLDIKSFRPPVGWKVGKSLDRVIGRVIANERYDLQAASYRKVWNLARPLFEAGQVFGANDEEKALLKAAFAREDMKWIWAFVKNAGAPQTVVREFQLNSFALRGAEDEIEHGLSEYRRYVAEFGPDKDWFPRHAAAVLTDEDFPSYLGA